MIIENKTFDEERALYALKNSTVKNCLFKGEADGESALKESRHIEVENCGFYLRYPLWHTKNTVVRSSEMTETCRAAVWYADNIELSDCVMNGIKALRECKAVTVQGCTVNSPEFAWKCRKISIDGTVIVSEYPFFECKDLAVSATTLKGKYSFQYVTNGTIENSAFKTKDAFWHAKNVTVKDTVIDGEYTGWYSENLHFVNCTIKGTQPFCYCKGLVLENCKMPDCDLAFEKSDVTADIKGTLISIKNPLSGSITCDGADLINDTNTSCKINFRK